jgi:hypothetical protein
MYRHNAERALEKMQAVEPPTNAVRRAHNIARGELAERDAHELLAIRLSLPPTSPESWGKDRAIRVWRGLGIAA